MIGCVTIRWVFEGLDSDPILCVVGRYLRLGNNSFQILTSLCSLGGGASLSCSLFHRCFETFPDSTDLSNLAWGCKIEKGLYRYVSHSSLFISNFSYLPRNIYFIYYRYNSTTCATYVCMCVIMCVLLVLSPGTCTLFVIKRSLQGTLKGTHQKLPTVPKHNY